MFGRAILRKPSPSLGAGLTRAELGIPDPVRASRQHQIYCGALRRCGLKLTELEADAAHPDSTFVEDTAVLLDDCAVLTHPGASSRRGEVAAIRAVLQQYFATTAEIAPHGHLDGGDVMVVGRTIYIGLSARTDAAGAVRLACIGERHGYRNVEVPAGSMLHLKSGANALDTTHLLVVPELANHPAFADFERLIVPAAEAYAANSLWVNGRVLVPAGFPRTQMLIEDQGYETIALKMTEFQKQDGGLSCLSLRF